MQSWTPILIIVLLGLVLFTWAAYKGILLNKAVLVKRINPELYSVGDIRLGGDSVEVKFFWSIKAFSLRQIEQIKAYAQTDWGLEEHEQADVLFDTGDVITFDCSQQEHREFVQTITQRIGIDPQVWTWGFLPHLGDKMGKDLIFEKNKATNQHIAAKQAEEHRPGL